MLSSETDVVNVSPVRLQDGSFAKRSIDAAHCPSGLLQSLTRAEAELHDSCKKRTTTKTLIRHAIMVPWW